MPTLDQIIDEKFSELRSTCGGVRNDYFGLVYLEQEFGLSREQAISQNAFGNSDFGIDGFHFDRETRNLYLFQFKYSKSHALFAESFKKLLKDGMEALFRSDPASRRENQLLSQIRSAMYTNRVVIAQVVVQFVFIGDPDDAERSQVLDKLREDLENKHHLITEFFKRDVSFLIEFKSASTKKVSQPRCEERARSYQISMPSVITRNGVNGEIMHVGFVPLYEIHTMYDDMRLRFLDRNIRGTLSEDTYVNREILKAIKRVVIDCCEDPSMFAFNHNGITLSAAQASFSDGVFTIVEPRVLNGGQTVTTMWRFLKKDNLARSWQHEELDRLKKLSVLCKIVTDANEDFITTVTVNNNKQNPVKPWNLHSNDMIQHELQDKFWDDLKILYERQENLVEKPDDDESDAPTGQPIELVTLAKTFLVSEGDIARISHVSEVFESEKVYASVFCKKRLSADSRHIVLCYKIERRLNKLCKSIFEKGERKYWYMNNAKILLWSLMCQAILNDEDLEQHAEMFGKSLQLPAQFTELLVGLAVNQCRFIISDLAEEAENASLLSDGKTSFFKSNRSYKTCMEIAKKKYGWTQKNLK